MNWQGLNFGPGFAAMGDSMAKGYSDYQDMIQNKMKMDIAARQAAVQEQEGNYKYPAETVIPQFIGNMANPNFLQETQQSLMGQQSGTRPIIGVNAQTGSIKQLMPGRPAVAPSTTTIPNPLNPIDRDPQSEPEANVEFQDESENTKKIAKQLGLHVNDQGQLIAKGKQGEMILSLYEKMLGAAAGSGVSRGMQPQVVQYGRAQGTPQDPTQKRIKDNDARMNQILSSQTGLSGKLGGPDKIKNPALKQEYMMLQEANMKLRGLGTPQISPQSLLAPKGASVDDKIRSSPSFNGLVSQYMNKHAGVTQQQAEAIVIDTAKKQLGQ